MFGDKFDPNNDVRDLSGNVYVVTGGSAGIGFGICAHLLQHNCDKLYILGRKQDHLAGAQESLAEYGDTTRVVPIQIDLADLHQTHEVVTKLATDLTRLDALILNAGLGVGPYAESKDGIDTHMQVNVFAQYHLLRHLLPLLIATKDSRCVMQSSEFHRLGTKDVQFANLAEINQDIGPSKLYARTKLAMVCLTIILARLKTEGRLGMTKAEHPWFLATHPGGVVTDQQDQAVEAYGTMGKLGVKAARMVMKDPVEEGCRPALFAATSQAVANRKNDGEYVVPDKEIKEPSKQAQEVDLQERCLRLTEDVLRAKLGNLGYETVDV